jgi:alpha-tubulin suppressor-like RCC1 family protein
VTLPATPIGLSAGSDHTCALLQDGTVRCWGSNSYGELGVAGASGAALRQPMFTQSVKAITAGDQHNCAILADDSVACWGRGTWGQLGDGQQMVTGTPAPVVGY